MEILEHQGFLSFLGCLCFLQVFKRYNEFSRFSCEFNMSGRPLTILVGNGPPIIDSESEEEQECNEYSCAGTPWNSIGFWWVLFIVVCAHIRLAHSDCKIFWHHTSNRYKCGNNFLKPFNQLTSNFEARFCMTLHGPGTCEELLCIQDPEASKIEDLT